MSKTQNAFLHNFKALCRFNLCIVEVELFLKIIPVNFTGAK